MNITMSQVDLKDQLKAFAKEVGETSENAVARWGVSVCRELAWRTEARGKTAAARKLQDDAISAEMHRTATVTENKEILKQLAKGKTVRMRVGGMWADVTPDRFARNGWELNRFASGHRGARGKIGRITASRRMVCSKSTMKDAIKWRTKFSGQAKGGWIEAGKAIAATQRGLDRVTIGKNFLGYAHKFQNSGSARMNRGGKAVATMTNHVPHAGKEYVLKSSAVDQALKESFTAVWKYYKKTLNAIKRKAK